LNNSHPVGSTVPEQVRSQPPNAEDRLWEKWGCAVIVVATLLTAIQRCLAFALLGQRLQLGSQTAQQLLEFLFGKAPFSVFDIVFGLEVPSETWVALFRIRSLLVVFFQAAHLGLNLCALYFPLQGISKLSERSRLARPLASGGYAAAYVVLAMLITLVPLGVISLVTTPTGTASIQTAQYSNDELGIAFEYPDYLSIQTDERHERGSGGELVTLSSVIADSSDSPVMIAVRVIDDPSLHEMYPDLYPPDDKALRIMTTSDIIGFYDSASDEEFAEIQAVREQAVIMEVCGFPAAAYAFGVDTTDLGHVYVRGALVITDRRDISLFVTGSNAPGANGGVEPAYVDGLWSQLIQSLRLEF